MVVHRQVRQLLVLLVLSAALAGCAGNRGATRGDPSVREEVAATSGAYLLRSGDQVRVRFPTDVTLDYAAPVTPSGTFIVPSGQEIPAAGLTLAQLKSAIEVSIKDMLLDPVVTVVLTSVADQLVYVIGEVKSPGPVDRSRGVRLSMALSEAGGVLSTGKVGSVMIVRTEGLEEPTAFRVDFGDVLSGRDLSQDVELLPNDVVYVPKSVIGKVGEFVDLFFAQIAPAQLFYLRGYDILNDTRTPTYE